jgi:hypothetical protein
VRQVADFPALLEKLLRVGAEKYSRSGAGTGAARKRVMTPATYSLCPDGSPPERYYRAVATFADALLAAGREELGLVLAGYEGFVREHQVERLRTRSEYLLDALTLGVLWRAHGAGALRVGGARARLMETLAARGPRELLRPGVDCLRRSADACLLASVDDPWEPGGPTPSLDDLERLLTWLAATGEYDEEVSRLEPWGDFLHSDPLLAEWMLAEIVLFAAEMEDAAAAALGGYTSGVERFLRNDLVGHRWHEDLVQCGRRRAEYHLNMVGAEILNRAWRAEFERAPRKVVVLPACMRALPDERCRAEREEGGQLRCTGCAPRCAVAEIRALAARAGAEVIAVQHGSDFGRLVRAPALAAEGTAIVGVACVPGLVGAGWKARAAGLPAQCVLLEYSGCRAHWHPEGVPTRIHLGELARILGVERERAASVTSLPGAGSPRTPLDSASSAARRADRAAAPAPRRPGTPRSATA